MAHPLSANVDFKKVVHLLEDLGAEVDNKPGNGVGVMLNGRSAAFAPAHRAAKGGSRPGAEVS